MLEEILDKAKALTEAITWASNDDLWKTDLSDTVSGVKYDDIEDKLLALKQVIEDTEKYLYDQDANNHPVWRELGIDPYHNRGDSPFDHLDGDYDPDAGREWWRVWWDKEEIFVYIQIDYTVDGGRDWGTVTVDNWKSEKDTVKWLRDRDVDVDNELSDDYIIDEAHGFQEIVPFQDGFLIKRELGEEQE